MRESSPQPLPPPEKPYEPKAPFPQRLIEPSHFGKKGEKISEMMEMFQQVKINIPLLDAIRQVPAYAKFLKECCTHKRKAKNKEEKSYLTKNVSALLQHSIPQKLKDPGAPTISCTIGDHKIQRALLDLGASVNLIPYSVYLQLGLEEMKPTPVVLQLTDRSLKKPRGVVEDVIVQVDRFYFPVDFLVLDTEPVHDPTKHIPIILGRPFLATSRANIDCESGAMDLSFGNMKVRLNVFNASHHPINEFECFYVDIIEESMEEALPYILSKDPLEACLSYFGSDNFDVEQSILEVNALLEAPPMKLPPWKLPIEPLPKTSSTPLIPSLESPPELELKPLPEKLKYAYLGAKETLPVIISSALMEKQESDLIEVLKEHKEAI